ncbi:BZ3500_MvSof-1268-A1-R1_Chr6-3g08640 [Microbotryum saponariae]|uniref:BZ3500_MvSof-1268-A1-R1_Chr6-3g08640 protein n=1 Tax=Microbotryum saponariae TaxID=289078 RepID=A0A2X0LJJ3_9BASI|nr:BZ3500_MvSof-1268-A1-R1_Chr6-3g08640 [Microbotryum saponariae]SDA07241.1 BZ3501_MvSof-1269-A2-R1_Chr6-2g08343 [Microbotryum saponariae]
MISGILSSSQTISTPAQYSPQDPTNANAVAGPSKVHQHHSVKADLEQLPGSDAIVDAILTSTSNNTNTTYLTRRLSRSRPRTSFHARSSSSEIQPPPPIRSSPSKACLNDDSAPSGSSYRFPLAKISTTLEHLPPLDQTAASSPAACTSGLSDVEPLIAHLDAIALERDRLGRHRLRTDSSEQRSTPPPTSPREMLDFADFVSETFRLQDASAQGTNAGAGTAPMEDHIDGGVDYLTPMQRGSFQLAEALTPVQNHTTYQFPRVETMSSLPIFPDMVPRTPRTSSLHATDLQRLISSQSCDGRSIDLIDFESPSRKSLVVTMGSTPSAGSAISTAAELSPLHTAHQLSDHGPNSAPPTPSSVTGSVTNSIPFPGSAASRTIPLPPIRAESTDPHQGQVETSSDEGHPPPMANQSMDDNEEALDDEEDEEDLTEDEEDEDPDSHPLYVLLSSSAIPVLRSAWDAATLILVPPRRTLPSLEALTPRRESAAPAFEFVRGGKGVAGEQAGRDVEKERQMSITYVALHAFKPLENDEDAAPGTTSWRSVIASEEGHCRARLIPGQGTALIDWIEMPGPIQGIKSAQSTSSFASSGSDNGSKIGSTQARSPQSPTAAVVSLARNSFSLITPVKSLRIIAETTIYRRPRQIIAATNPPPAPSTLSASTNSTLGKSSGSSSLHKSGFRTPKWFRRSISSAIPTLKTWPEKTDADLNPPSFVTPTLAPVRETSKSGPMLERVRVLALGGGIVMRRGSTSASTTSQRRTLHGTSIPSDPEPIIRTSASSISLRLFGTDSPLGSNNRSQSSLALSRHPTFELVGETTSSQGHGAPSTRRRAGSMSSTRSARSGRSAFGIVAMGANGMMRGEFLADLAFLASPPPQLAGLGPVFASTLKYIRALVREFEGGVAYIRGLEPYLIQRIRKGIFDRIWQQIVRDLDADEELRTWLVSEEHATNLRLLIENVIIGLLYRKLYTSSILPHFSQEDATLNSIISTYQERQVLPTDFGVHFDSAEPLANGALKTAITILQDLKETSEVATKVPDEVAQLWVLSAATLTTRRPGPASTSGRDDRSKSPSPSPASTAAPTIQKPFSITDAGAATRPLRGVRTPLGCVTIIAESLQAMVYAIETLQGGSRLAPDDLIPLFSWVIVKAGVENLESLLFFVKTFRLSENLPSHLDWSFVNFQAALAFLLSDPLHCLPEPPAMSTPTPFFGIKSADASTTARTRRLSLQQYRPTHAGISPPSSPKSARGTGAGWYSPGTTSVNREQSTSPTASLPFPNYARERRLSWQQASKAPKRVSVTLDADLMLPPRFERLTSAEEMPPPSWKLPPSSRNRHHVDSGRSVTPQSETSEDGDASAATRHLRALSLASLSSEGGTPDSRPRLALPLEGMSRDRIRVPSLSRSYSALAMMTRPPAGGGGDMSFGLSSTDMRRSESEGSPVVPDRSTYADRWSLWGALPSSTVTSNAPSSHRAVSPFTSENTSSQGPPSSYDAHSQSWWSWGGGLSTGALYPASQLAAPLYPVANDASTHLRRLRRFSASTAEILADRPAHLVDQVVSQSNSSSSIRLTAILQNKTSETDMLPLARPRPRSTMSVSSIGSNASFVLSSESEETSSVPAAALASTLSPSIVAPPPPRRKSTRSRTWRELPTSNLAGAPLAPRLDSTSIVSIPRTEVVASIEANLAAPNPGLNAAQSSNEPRTSFDTSRSVSFELTRSPEGSQPTSPCLDDPPTTTTTATTSTLTVPLMT